MADSRLQPGTAPEGCRDAQGIGRWTNIWLRERLDDLPRNIREGAEQHFRYNCPACRRTVIVFMAIEAVFGVHARTTNQFRVRLRAIPGDIKSRKVLLNMVCTDASDNEEAGLELYLAGKDVGGDESLFDHWRTCDACVAAIQDMLANDALINEIAERVRRDLEAHPPA